MSNLFSKFAALVDLQAQRADRKWSAFGWLSGGAAVTLCLAVGDTLFGWTAIEPALPFAAALVASGTLLTGMALSHRLATTAVSAVSVAAAWLFIAGMSAAAMPLIASVLAISAIVTLYMLAHKQGSNIEAAQVEPVAELSVARSLIDRQGRLISDLYVGENIFAAGSNFVARIHMTEQVAVLHDLQDLATGAADKRSRTVRFNVSRADEAAAYVDLNLEFQAGEFGIAVTRATLDIAAVTPDHSADSHKRILAVASHELRTPLNAIIGFSEVLRMKTFGDFVDPRQEEYIGMIHDAGNDLLTLVNTILDVSKIEAGSYALHPEPFDISKTVFDTMRLIETEAQRKKLHLSAHCDADDRDYVADRRAVRQILTNLLSNAVKFTPDGGCVGVELARLADGGFTLCVTDTGIGMSEHEIATLFKPFAQIDNAYTRQCEGTGLGLALVKGLVDLHGGSIEVVSDADVGTAITAIFPSAGHNLVRMARPQTKHSDDTAAMASLFQRKAV